MHKESCYGSLWFWVPMLLISFGIVLVVRFLRSDIFGIVFVLNSYPKEYVFFLACYIMVPVSLSFVAAILLDKLYDYVSGILASDREG